jgi:hypothetical protein
MARKAICNPTYIFKIGGVAGEPGFPATINY